MKIVKGNLLDLAEAGDFDIIVQGCNCFCTMGSGIAREIRERYSQAYAIDASTDEGNYNKLGNYTMAPSSLNPAKSKFVIVNAYVQYEYNSIGEFKDVFEYTSFKLILQKMAHEFPAARFGFPLIGCGLAGGNKTKILGMIGEFSEIINSQGGSVTIVEFTQ